MLAHRLSYELHVGLIPSNLFVLHKCDNRGCVNPDHLFLGTALDNQQDMWAKGRGPDRRGEKSGRTDFTADDIREMKKRFRNIKNSFIEETARKYGVTKMAIRYILDNKRWAHIEADNVYDN